MVRKLSVETVYYIERDPGVTRAELTRAIAAEPDPAKRKRLEATLGELAAILDAKVSHAPTTNQHLGGSIHQHPVVVPSSPTPPQP